MVDTEELIEKLYRHANDYAEGNTQDFADVFRDCKLAADTISTLKFSKKIMFDDIKKCLDDYEDSYNKLMKTDEEEYVNDVLYFEMYLAEEFMKNKYCDSEKLARIIMANKC